MTSMVNDWNRLIAILAQYLPVALAGFATLKFVTRDFPAHNFGAKIAKPGPEAGSDIRGRSRALHVLMRGEQQALASG
jgi:hypothetical protein